MASSSGNDDSDVASRAQELLAGSRAEILCALDQGEGDPWTLKSRSRDSSCGEARVYTANATGDGAACAAETEGVTDEGGRIGSAAAKEGKAVPDFMAEKRDTALRVVADELMESEGGNQDFLEAGKKLDSLLDALGEDEDSDEDSDPDSEDED